LVCDQLDDPPLPTVRAAWWAGPSSRCKPMCRRSPRAWSAATSQESGVRNQGSGIDGQPDSW